MSTVNRWPGLPQLPTVNETGVANLELEAWFGIFTRSGAPPAALDRLRQEMARVVDSPDVVAKLGGGAARMLKMSSGQAEEFVRSEVLKWSAVIRKAGISAE
jgi:tripartite-type tricarboxylate transporter receptor subunit TctC